jgi:hypothetical protein
MTVRLALFYFFLIVMFTDTVLCQTALVPNSNATSPFQNRLTLQNEGDNAALTVHRDSFGRPCLNIEGVSRKDIVNPNIYQHVISVYNQCLTMVKVHVCYYHSDHCIDMSVPGSQRRDNILGIYPNMRYFRFSYQEKF